MHGQQNIKKY